MNTLTEGEDLVNDNEEKEIERPEDPKEKHKKEHLKRIKDKSYEEKMK